MNPKAITENRLLAALKELPIDEWVRLAQYFEPTFYQEAYRIKLGSHIQFFIDQKYTSLKPKELRGRTYLRYKLTEHSVCRIDPLKQYYYFTIFGDKYSIPFGTDLGKASYLSHKKSELINTKLYERFGELLEFETYGTTIEQRICNQKGIAAEVGIPLNRDPDNIFGKKFKLHNVFNYDADSSEKIQFVVFNKNLKLVNIQDPEAYWYAASAKKNCTDEGGYPCHRAAGFDILFNITDKVFRFGFHPCWPKKVRADNIGELELMLSTEGCGDDDEEDDGLTIVPDKIMLSKQYEMTTLEQQTLSNLIAKALLAH